MQVDSDDNFYNICSTDQSQVDIYNKPTIYIKIIRAFNLMDVDSGGTSDPYVQITVNRKKDKTYTRKKDINPEWGEVFQFDWARGSRYANIEVWDSNDSTSHVYLGGLSIPLFHLYGSISNTSWYNLGKRSTRSNIRGKIEIEYSCTGFPGIDINVIKLYREIVSMRDMHIPFLRLDGEANGYKSFPFALPSIESGTHSLT
jgi:Ca2+-dependent lipid-binding protein